MDPYIDGEAPPPSAYHHLLVVPSENDAKDKYQVCNANPDMGILGTSVCKIVVLGAEDRNENDTEKRDSEEEDTLEEEGT